MQRERDVIVAPWGRTYIGNNKQKRMWMKKRLDGGINNNLSGSISEIPNRHYVVFMGAFKIQYVAPTGK